MARVLTAIACFFGLMMLGLFSLVFIGSSQPELVCQVKQSQGLGATLPTLKEYSEEQWRVAQVIVDNTPGQRVEVTAIAVAIALASTELSDGSTDGGNEPQVNPVNGEPLYASLPDEVGTYIVSLTADNTWVERPATEVVAVALGDPKRNVDSVYEQAALITAKLTNTDAQYLLEQKVKDPGCTYESLEMGEIVTVDGVTFPVPGYTAISSRFGYRFHPVLGVYRLHAGVDFAAPCGAPIVPVMPGIVVRVNEREPGFGSLVQVEHDNGNVTWYGHMFPGTVYVKEGDRVTPGQRMADVGSAGTSTGCHLHIELHTPSGSAVDVGRAFGWY